MSEDIKSFLTPDELEINGVMVRKPTAGTLALCDIAKLSMTSGQDTDVPFFEALAFFYIHANKLVEVRTVLFDNSLGRSEAGRSLAFESAVIDWADNVDLGSIGQMGEKISELLGEAMDAKVEVEEKTLNPEDVSAVITEKKM